ncbi:MAG: substrate-binding domain-containing protein [Actinobacteria bacterium]|nr:substrate-binding domain-containing protein [Actinomycetota bacterium]
MSPRAGRPPRGRSRVAAALAVAAAVASCAVAPAAATPGRATAPAAPRAAGAAINGTGSSYVGLAMQQWTAEGTTLGYQVNYTPSGSPDGLSRYKGGLVDFAGTEAEFASLAVQGTVSRGFQYVPDVGGAVAVMYNVDDLSGRRVDYLHLSRRTVAKIFLGEISRWNDPAIAADNAPANLRLPDKAINVVYRGGQSGTTALFYDFIRETEPTLFDAWTRRNRLPTSTRIIDLDVAPGFAPKVQAIGSSEQIAQHLASPQGKWSIAYDEFGYAKTYRATSAWIDNSGGKWTLPYAENISAALESASLRSDLSQELSGVYRSTNPLTYPISAYSYLVVQCHTGQGRGTCTGPYANPGVTETLSGWMRYIACDGQIRMARLGYSPLPPNLSQEISNAIGRLTGRAAEKLSAGNCGNPRFRGSLGAGAGGPTDPYEALPAGGSAGSGDGGGGASSAGDGSGGSGGGSGDTTDGSGDTTDGGSLSDAAGSDSSESSGIAAAAGRTGSAAALGGSDTWRTAEPAVYGAEGAAGSRWPAAALLALVAVPAVGIPLLRRIRRTRSPAPTSPV